MKENNVNKNTFFNTFKTIFGIVFPLLTFPYISRVLGAENIGKINFSNSIVSYFSLMASLGVTTYAVRECSKVRDDKEKLGNIASQIFSINLVSTLISYVILFIGLRYVSSLEDYRALIMIQSTIILFTTLGADWLNTAMEDFKYIAVRTMAVQLLSLLAMFIWVRDKDDYVIYAVISMLATSGANIINLFYRKRYCKTRFTIKMNMKEHLPPILLLFSMTLTQTIYVNSDVTMLGFIRGDHEVGLYSTSVKIYNLVNTVIASIAWVVMPQLSALFSKKDYSNINRLLKYSLNYIIVLGIPCFTGMNVIAPQLIETIAGRDYLGATNSLHILSFSLVFSLVGGFIGNIIMLPSGREKICLKSSMISSIVNFVLNCFLIPVWGLNGAALTTALAELVGILIVFPKIEREIKIERPLEMLKAPVTGAVFITLYSMIVKNIFRSAYAITFVTIIGSVCIYVIVLAVMKNEFFMELLRPMTGKRKNR